MHWGKIGQIQLRKETYWYNDSLQNQEAMYYSPEGDIDFFEMITGVL